MRRLNAKEIKSAANGRWYGICASFGIEVPDSPKKHGACPICGPGNNSHRFRFDDKDGDGTWICTNCGAGDAIRLVQMALGLTFVETLERINEIVGSVEYKQPKQQEKDPRPALRAVAEKSIKLTGDDPVSRYLRDRGIITQTNNLKYCSKCYEPETMKEIPAMIAMIQGPCGEYRGIHRTYLSQDYKKADIKSPKKLMPPLKPLVGSAIRLFKADTYLGIAEGIETACAAHQLSGMPVWACISTSLLESFVPPDGIVEIIIFGDNDKNYAGQKSAYRLANRLYNEKYVVDVRIPETPGNDWCDELNLDRPQDNI